MSLNPRLLGHGVQMATIRWVDCVTEPPATGDPMLYRNGLELFLTDSEGVAPLAKEVGQGGQQLSGGRIPPAGQGEEAI